MSDLSKCYSLVYELDKAMKTFTQYRLKSCEEPLLTDLIRIEENNGYNSISGTKILKIRDASNWKLCTITGLIPLETTNTFRTVLKDKTTEKLLTVSFIDSSTVNIIIQIK